MNRKLIVRAEFTTARGTEVVGHTFTVDARIRYPETVAMVNAWTREQIDAERMPWDAIVSHRLTAAF